MTRSEVSMMSDVKVGEFLLTGLGYIHACGIWFHPGNARLDTMEKIKAFVREAQESDVPMLNNETEPLTSLDMAMAHVVRPMDKRGWRLRLNRNDVVWNTAAGVFRYHWCCAAYDWPQAICRSALVVLSELDYVKPNDHGVGIVTPL